VTRGRVTAILYSRLATSLRSLAIILLYLYTYYHSHPRLQPYSYNYNPYAYEAERRRTCPYTIIAFSVKGYVSLMGFREFTPFSDAWYHEVNNWEYSPPNEISKHHYCEAPSVDQFIIQLSHMRAVKSSTTNWRTRRVTSNDDDHEYRTRLFDPANERNCKRPIELSWNTVPTSQLSEIISQRTYNRRSDLTPECGHIENQRRSRETIYESAQLQLHSF